MGRLVWVVASIVVIFLVALLSPSLVLVFADPRIFAAKQGTVVDAQSGQALSGVYVIATASASWSTLIGSTSSRILYRHVIKTNSFGQYSIPSDWLAVPLWFPPLQATKPYLQWSITAFQFGDIVVGDDWGMALDQLGESLAHPESTSKLPRGVLQGDRMRVDTIKMRPVNFNEQQMSTYYSAIIAPNRNPQREISHQEDEVEMRRRVYNALSRRLCSLPRDLLIAWSIEAFVKEPNGFVDKLALAEPDAFQHALERGAPPAVHAGTECDLLKTEEGGPPR